MTVAAIARALGKALIAFADELAQPAATPAAAAKRDPHSTTAAVTGLRTMPAHAAGFRATARGDQP